MTNVRPHPQPGRWPGSARTAAWIHLDDVHGAAVSPGVRPVAGDHARPGGGHEHDDRAADRARRRLGLLGWLTTTNPRSGGSTWAGRSFLLAAASSRADPDPARPARDGVPSGRPTTRSSPSTRRWCSGHAPSGWVWPSIRPLHRRARHGVPAVERCRSGCSGRRPDVYLSSYRARRAAAGWTFYAPLSNGQYSPGPAPTCGSWGSRRQHVVVSRDRLMATVFVLRAPA